MDIKEGDFVRLTEDIGKAVSSVTETAKAFSETKPKIQKSLPKVEEAQVAPLKEVVAKVDESAIAKVVSKSIPDSSKAEEAQAEVSTKLSGISDTLSQKPKDDGTKDALASIQRKLDEKPKEIELEPDERIDEISKSLDSVAERLSMIEDSVTDLGKTPQRRTQNVSVKLSNKIADAVRSEVEPIRKSVEVASDDSKASVEKSLVGVKEAIEKEATTRTEDEKADESVSVVKEDKTQQADKDGGEFMEIRKDVGSQASEPSDAVVSESVSVPIASLSDKLDKGMMSTAESLSRIEDAISALAESLGRPQQRQPEQKTQNIQAKPMTISSPKTTSSIPESTFAMGRRG